MSQASQSTQWTEPMRKLRGPWLGQGEPKPVATEFCADVLGSRLRVSGITFDPSGEEAFFSLNTPDGESADLMETRMVDGVWTNPEAAPFNSDQIDNDISMSPDGKRLIWRSWRPLPGNTDSEKGVSLWAADRGEDGWGEPFPVECGGERKAAVYPGISDDGTLYFSVRVAVVDGEPEYAILRARRAGSQYATPEAVIGGLTSAADLCVAPDESFLVATIFRQPRFKGQADLHVSYQQPDGSWTELFELGDAVRSEITEFCPTISADGTRLFFCRIDREDRSVPARAYWVDARTIAQRREELERVCPESESQS